MAHGEDPLADRFVEAETAAERAASGSSVPDPPEEAPEASASSVAEEPEGEPRLICGPSSVSWFRSAGRAVATAATTAIRAMRTAIPAPMALLVNMTRWFRASMR